MIVALAREWRQGVAYFYGNPGSSKPSDVIAPPSIGKTVQAYLWGAGCRDEDMHITSDGLQATFRDGSTLFMARDDIGAPLTDDDGSPGTDGC